MIVHEPEPNAVDIAGLIASAAAACDARANEAMSGNDSEGVTIVENTTEEWTDQTAWRLDPEPMLSIGRVDGPPEYQLFQVTGALRLDDGNVVVAGAASSEVRFYDRTGNHVRSVGGRGAGPGEYQLLRVLWRFGRDSLVAWDSQLDRGTVIATDGTYGRSITRPNYGGRFVYYVDAFDDGSLLGVLAGGGGVEAEVLRPASFQRKTRTGVVPDSVLLFRLGPSSKVDTIGVFFKSESYTSPAGSVSAFAVRPSCGVCSRR